MSVDFYKKVGYNPPWICYYVAENEKLVGCAAIKGKPINNRVEIAYGVFPEFYNKGIGTKIANILVELSKNTDPSVIITARTLPEKNFSARILLRNNFKLLGLINDPEDGDIWEWEYID